MSALEQEILGYAKLVIPDDVKLWIRAIKAKYGAAAVSAKLEGLLGVDGASEFLAWLKKQPSKTQVKDAPAPGLTLRSAKWSGFPKIVFDCPAVATWPKKTGTNNKTVQGLLRINGQKVEWIGAGRNWVSAENAVNEGKYHQDIGSGRTVRVTLCDINGKNETNAQELVWP